MFQMCVHLKTCTVMYTPMYTTQLSGIWQILESMTDLELAFYRSVSQLIKSH